MGWKLVYYRSRSGRDYVDEFIKKKLTEETRFRVLSSIRLLGEFGVLLSYPHVRQVDSRLQELAVFLVGLRIKNHWTQHQLAQELGLKQSEISLMETGERNVSLKTLQRIAETAGKQISIQFLEPSRTGRV